MAKKDEDVSRLEKQVRELKSTIRTLEKRLKRIDKDFRVEMEEAQKERHYEDAVEVAPKSKKCPECTRGNVIETNLRGRIFYRCSIDDCGYKGRIK